MNGESDILIFKIGLYSFTKKIFLSKTFVHYVIVWLVGMGWTHKDGYGRIKIVEEKEQSFSWRKKSTKMDTV